MEKIQLTEEDINYLNCSLLTDISKVKYLNDKGYTGLAIPGNGGFNEPERPFLEKFAIMKQNFI